MSQNGRVQKITTFLWFDQNAEEAVRHYVSVFPNSRIRNIAHYGEAASEASGQPKGTVMVVFFELAGQEFMALNGGPMFKFTEAISLLVRVADQAELDEINAKLIADGGEQSACGWVKDKFGLSWQVVPEAFDKVMTGDNEDKKERVMHALMGMTKIDIAALENA